MDRDELDTAELQKRRTYTDAAIKADAPVAPHRFAWYADTLEAELQAARDERDTLRARVAELEGVLSALCESAAYQPRQSMTGGVIYDVLVGAEEYDRARAALGDDDGQV